MATISETGYAKLIANLKVLISAAIRFAEKFNPSKPSLKPDSMSALAVKCDNAMLDVSNAMAAYKIALDTRDQAFSLLGKLVTRVMNALLASESSERIDGDARSIARKIMGKSRKTSSTEKNGQEPEDAAKEISVSQMSFDHRINNFQDLIQLLSGTPAYMPNEPELQTASLNKYKEKLLALNSAVISAYQSLQAARAARNELLFKPGTGLVDVALDAKAYLKSVFGPSSPEYKQVSGLKFSA